jgi:hypothetical protein
LYLKNPVGRHHTETSEWPCDRLPASRVRCDCDRRGVMSTELPESDRLGEKLESAARGESKRRLVARIFSYTAMIAG